jgi:hypothetical protein
MGDIGVPFGKVVLVRELADATTIWRWVYVPGTKGWRLFEGLAISRLNRDLRIE